GPLILVALGAPHYAVYLAAHSSPDELLPGYGDAGPGHDRVSDGHDGGSVHGWPGRHVGADAGGVRLRRGRGVELVLDRRRADGTHLPDGVGHRPFSGRTVDVCGARLGA